MQIYCSAKSADLQQIYRFVEQKIKKIFCEILRERESEICIKNEKNDYLCWS